MFKVQLSSNLITEKVLVGIVWFATVILWTSVPGFYLPFIVLILAVIFLLYSAYVIYFSAVNISYDENFLFIADRKTERIIQLKSVVRIERVNSYDSPRRKWKITYLENGLDEELYFYPKDKADMVQFIRAVKVQNPIATATDIS